MLTRLDHLRCYGGGRPILTAIAGILVLLALEVSVASAQNNVGIGTTTPNSSAILDLTSTGMGLLVPRMSTANKLAITTPATGLLVFDNTLNAFYYYNGSAWVPFLSSSGSSAGWLLTGNAGTSAGTNFIGTTDAQDLVFKTNGTEGMRYVDGQGLAIGVTSANEKLEVGGNIRIDEVGGSASTLLFQNPAGTHFTSFKAGSQAADIPYVLPTSQASAGQYLKNDGAGNLSWASISGGGSDLWERGDGSYSLIGIGSGNSTDGNYAIAAGQNNEASGDYSTIIGGLSNHTESSYSVIAGGQSNHTEGSYSSIGGGYANHTTASYSVIAGGQSNETTGSYAFVGSGYSNIASGTYSVISGGQSNHASASNSFIGGGYNNTASNTYAVVSGGQSNQASGSNSSVSGGYNNIASSTYASINGGQSNTASANASTVGGGSSNSASGNYSGIAAGLNNTASGAYSIVGGGQSNTASAQYAIAGGGLNTQATGSYSATVGGQSNTSAGQWSGVLGGLSNQVTSSGSYSAVLGGQSNTVSGNWSLAFGAGANVTQDNTVVFNHPSSGSQTRLGIRTNSPSEALDLLGNILVEPYSGQAGQLQLQNPAGNHKTSFQAGAQAADISYTLPTSQGGSGTVLTNNGSGTLSWASAGGGGSGWSLTGNSGTTAGTDYLGTSDATDLRIKTNATDRIAILSSGYVGIGLTNPQHMLHVTSSTTTGEKAAIYGENTASTSNQAIGIWGAATNGSTSNTGTIGVFATGNGNTTAGQTNIALQVNDGEIAMGRTTEASSPASVVESATGGTSYSSQGPSGVLEFTLGATGDLVTTKPTSGTFQNLGTVTINNQYVTSTSIVSVNVVDKIDQGTNPSPANAVFITDVQSRSAGSFVMRIGMIPTASNASNFQTGDKIRIGYLVVNATR